MSKHQLNVERHVFEVAREIKRAAPWERFEEHDLFAVQVEETLYFVSIRGAEKIAFGISIYKDLKQLNTWNNMYLLVNDESAADRAFQGILEQDCVTVDFEPKESLFPGEIERVRRSGVRFRGLWPELLRYRPGRRPRPVNEEEMRRLDRVLPALMAVFNNRAAEDAIDLALDVMENEDEDGLAVPVFNERGELFRIVICDDDVYFPKFESLSEFTKERLTRRTKRSDEEVVIDLVMMNGVIDDDDPWHPYLLLMVRSDGRLIGGELMRFEDIPRMFAEQVAGLLIKARIVPKTIIAGQPKVLVGLNQTKEDFGVELVNGYVIEEVQEHLAKIRRDLERLS